MFLRTITPALACLTCTCVCIAQEPSMVETSLLDTPARWLMTALEHNRALGVYVAMRDPVRPDSAVPQDAQPTAEVDIHLRELRLRPKTWHAHEWPALETWLTTMRPLISQYATTSPRHRMLDTALRRDVDHGIVALVHIPLFATLRSALVADIWRDGVPAADVVGHLSLLQRLADELATSRFGPDVVLAERVRDDITRTLVALVAERRLTGDQVGRIVTCAAWLEREDLRCTAGGILDASLAMELSTIAYLSKADNEGMRTRVASLNEARGAMLSDTEVEEAVRENLGRLRDARISLHCRLRESLAYLGSPDHDDRVRTLEAIAIAESGAPALTRLVSPEGYAGLFRAICDAEASRRARVWVRAVMLHSAGQLASGNMDGAQVWYRRPLWLVRDPYGSGAPLLLREDDSLVRVYSRGHNGLDDDCDPNADLLLFDVPARLTR